MTTKRIVCPMWLLLSFSYVALVLLASSLEAQVIRKNYREFTAQEKTDYINALNALWNDNGTNVIQNYANFHYNNQCPIHMDISFLPWHRQFLLDFETNQLKRINPNITIPYWDWRNADERTTNPPPPWFASDWLGQFNGPPWNLNRALGGGTLPTAAAIQNVLNMTVFYAETGPGSTFGGGSGNLGTPALGCPTQTNRSGALELQHNGPHNWVGGIMRTMESPRDPVFYWHHAIIDKLWQNWEDMPGHNSSFPPGETLSGYPGVDPNSLINSRNIKVWYAEQNQLTLDQYTVSGVETYKYVSAYAYPSGRAEEIIIAKNGFIVPSGQSCTFQVGSGGEIALQDGFSALSGSAFSASILSN